MSLREAKATKQSLQETVCYTVYMRLPHRDKFSWPDGITTIIWLFVHTLYISDPRNTLRARSFLFLSSHKDAKTTPKAGMYKVLFFSQPLNFSVTQRFFHYSLHFTFITLLSRISMKQIWLNFTKYSTNSLFI